ncbi:MAG: alpha/beta hydrolase [Hyphomicrobiaceae bacterium]|nr:alpha/beta hydrolase [Hyphomicrobiaceae bacterium]
MRSIASTADTSDYFDSRFVSVDRMRLHYVEHGVGAPVVWLHGNGSMVSDFLSSKVVARLVGRHRVVAFDRPGFGYSDRPRGQTWGPFEQARLFLRAFELLGIERPILVGHSWGALVALAAAMEAGRELAGLVLLSGYYYPEPWRDETRRNPLAGLANPLVDEIIRETVGPYVSRLMAPGAVRKVFAPCPVPERFMDSYSMPHAVRPSQMRAAIEEADMLMESARRLSELYGELDLPVRLVAGSADRIVPTHKHSARLHGDIARSRFLNVEGVGHMIHHSAPEQVVAAIEAVAEAVPSPPRVCRHWLHIDHAVAAAG